MYLGIAFRHEQQASRIAQTLRGGKDQLDERVLLPVSRYPPSFQMVPYEVCSMAPALP